MQPKKWERNEGPGTENENGVVTIVTDITDPFLFIG